MKIKIISFTALFFFTVCGIFGISFQGLNLSEDNRLLFRMDFESQNALFISDLTSLSLQQITAFPEKLEVVDNGKTILVRSRLGAAKIPAAGGLPSPLPGFPSFMSGNVPLRGRSQDFAASADGQWILYVEPISPAYGNLLLIETSSGVKRVISEKIELPAADFPARWNPDSRFFIYSKSGNLYYFPISSTPRSMTDERLRLVGSGGITSIVWGRHGDFFYLQGKTLYRIINTELFTRTIYGDFLPIGNVAGTIPLEFNPGFDRYWIAPDTGSILLYRNSRNIFLLPLGDYHDSSAVPAAAAPVLPHLMVPAEARNFNILWSTSGLLTITTSLPAGTTVWRFNIKGNAAAAVTTREIPSSASGALSPDGTRAVFWGETGLELWDYINWRPVRTLSREPVFSCAWIDSEEFIAGGGKYIEGFRLTGADARRRIICLSGAEEFGFESSGGKRILARTGTEWFASNGINSWAPETNPRPGAPSISSERFRVFLEPQSSGPYKNLPMIRNSASTGTISLVTRHSVNNAYAQGQGRRPLLQPEMPVALCFDLYDDDTGLSTVLDALNRFDLKATFFLNGEFIRRNPREASAIAEAGHEVSSMFFAPIDLTNSRYRVNQEFIAQGLARNEDDFFRATGKELKLIWHPPFFRTSDAINRAASISGYVTIDKIIDCGDSARQKTASQMIEQIAEERKAGAIIPLRLGLLPGGRDDYLYQRIDVVLDALLRSGCRIVPVSALIGK